MVIAAGADDLDLSHAAPYAYGVQGADTAHYEEKGYWALGILEMLL